MQLCWPIALRARAMSTRMAAIVVPLLAIGLTPIWSSLKLNIIFERDRALVRCGRVLTNHRRQLNSIWQHVNQNRSGLDQLQIPSPEATS